MAEPVNVLYISYDGMTDPLGQSQVIPYLEGLSKLGYFFTLLSFEKPERFEKFKADISNRLKQSNINWVPLPYTKKPPILSTLWDVRQMKKKAFELQSQLNFKIVHCRSYISSLIGVQLKKQHGVKFVFDMRGFYADERVDGGLWNLKNPVYKAVYDFFKRKEKQFLTEADYTISLTNNGKKEMQSWKEIPNQPIPIQVIPCCADLDKFSMSNVDAVAATKLKNELGIKEGDFVLSYVGSVGTWYLPNEMLDFFKCLLKYKPNAKFLFITGDEPAVILDKAKQKNISAEHFIIRYALHYSVPAYLTLSTASIFFIKPLFSKKASSPTKQGEIMGMGIPQVCNSGVGDIDEIVDSGVGALIHHFAEADYEKAINELLHTSYDSAYIRNRALQVYSLVAGVEKYKQVYEKVCSR